VATLQTLSVFTECLIAHALENCCRQNVLHVRFAALGSPTAMNIFRKLTLCKPQTHWLACWCELHFQGKTQAPDTQHKPVWITAVPRQVPPSHGGLLLTALFLSSSPAFGTNCMHATSLQQLGRSPVTPMQF